MVSIYLCAQRISDMRMHQFERKVMSGKDITEKVLEDYNDIFADIVNVLIYDGVKEIKERELLTGAS